MYNMSRNFSTKQLDVPQCASKFNAIILILQLCLNRLSIKAVVIPGVLVIEIIISPSFARFTQFKDNLNDEKMLNNLKNFELLLFTDCSVKSTISTQYPLFFNSFGI